MQARRKITGNRTVKKVASRGKNLGKTAAVKPKKVGLEDASVADILQDQMVAIQATNEHILLGCST